MIERYCSVVEMIQSGVSFCMCDFSFIMPRSIFGCWPLVCRFFFSVDGQTQLTKIVWWCTHNTPSLRSTSVHCGCCEFQSLSTSYTIIKYKKSCISTTDQVSLWMVFKRWIFHQIFHAQLILKYYTWKIHTAKCVCTRVRPDCDFYNTHTHTQLFHQFDEYQQNSSNSVDAHFCCYFSFLIKNW